MNRGESSPPPSPERRRSAAYEFAEFRLEPARRALLRRDGTALALHSRPFDTLVLLVNHAGRVVGRAELLETLWPGRVVEDNNLNQAIAAVRRAIGRQHIATVPGRGYQFVTTVREVPPETPPARQQPRELRVGTPLGTLRILALRAVSALRGRSG